MSTPLGIAVDLLVAVLLVATIMTSLRLSRRMAVMRADESAMRTTIADLVAATDTAERAITGLRTILNDCDRTLADKLREAERYSVDLAQRVEAGETVMSRIADIVESSRNLSAAIQVPVSPAEAKPAEQSVLPAPAGPTLTTEPPAGKSTKDEILKAAAATAQALAERAARRLDAKAA